MTRHDLSQNITKNHDQVTLCERKKFYKRFLLFQVCMHQTFRNKFVSWWSYLAIGGANSVIAVLPGYYSTYGQQMKEFLCCQMKQSIKVEERIHKLAMATNKFYPRILATYVLCYTAFIDSCYCFEYQNKLISCKSTAIVPCHYWTEYKMKKKKK